MKIIHLKTDEKFPLNHFKKTGFLYDSLASEHLHKNNLEFNVQSRSISAKEEAGLFLMPLNKVKISDSTFRILSVSKRMKSFDRLLIPENFSKKTIPAVLSELSVLTNEERIMFQLQQIKPDNKGIEVREIHLLSPESPDCKGKAVILPWYVDLDNWVNTGYQILDLHPAEFTPESGSGCWAILGGEDLNQETKELIRSLHHPASLVFTNTERKLIRDFDIPDFRVLGAFLDSPMEDKYHLYICLLHNDSREVSWFDYPSSTFGEMASEAIEALKIHLQQQTLI